MYGLKPETDLTFLLGLELIQVCIGRYGVQLEFHENVCINVESSFDVALPNEDVTRWKPEHPRDALAVLDCLHQKIASFSPKEDGTLTLVFENGIHIVLYDDDSRYEAYSITAPGHNIIV